jgi:hypothetical protein
MPSEKPWTVHTALFARKGYTSPVIQAARTTGVQLLTFEQMVSDPRRVPGRATRRWWGTLSSGLSSDLAVHHKPAILTSTQQG